MAEYDWGKRGGLGCAEANTARTAKTHSDSNKRAMISPARGRTHAGHKVLHVDSTTDTGNQATGAAQHGTVTRNRRANTYGHDGRWAQLRHLRVSFARGPHGRRGLGGECKQAV